MVTCEKCLVLIELIDAESRKSAFQIVYFWHVLERSRCAAATCVGKPNVQIYAHHNTQIKDTINVVQHKSPFVTHET